MDRRRAARLRAHADPRARRADARRVHLHDRPARLAAAAAAGRPRHRPDDQRGAAVGADRADRVPAGRDRQGAHRRLPRVVPEPEARAAPGRDVQARAVPAPPRQAPRARSARLGRLARDPVPAEGSRCLAAVLRDLRRDALGRDRSCRVPGDRADPVRRGRVRGVAALRPRPAPRRHLAARARPGEGVRAGLRAARAGGVRDGERWDRRDRSGPGIARPDPVRRDRLHLRGDRRGARVARDHGGAAPGPRARRQGAARRGAGVRRILDAARGRPVDAGRAAGVRDRRWRDADHPAHRRHVAVRELRGLEPDLELRPARTARPHLERTARATRTIRAPRPGGTRRWEA